MGVNGTKEKQVGGGAQSFHVTIQNNYYKWNKNLSMVFNTALKQNIKNNNSKNQNLDTTWKIEK